MTGIELLMQEMKKRGLSKTQCESNVVGVVLDIVANSGTLYSDTNEALKRLHSIQDAVIQETENLKYLEKREQELRTDIKEYYDENKAYIEAFNKSLENCETQDGRDTMRKAQLFVNSTKVDTKYDNTAFIIGLAAILSNGSVSALDELKKINPSMDHSPDLGYDYGRGTIQLIRRKLY